MPIGLIMLISTQKVLKTCNKHGSKYHFLSTYHKVKSYIRVSTSQGKTSTNKGLDYLDEDETGLEAMGPTQETHGKMNQRKIYNYAT